jgi:2,4-dienoyl-CoA reductase-like NADH-dependent reductase (Old Yellow Enzyme family)
MKPSDTASARHHQPFRFKTAEGLLRKAAALDISLPFDHDVGALLQPLAIGAHAVPNRIAVQPMEGCDGDTDGSPGELTTRRYCRYAEGGSGLIWFEATAILPEGRSNPRNLMLTRESLPGFRALVDATRQAAAAALGPGHRPFLVLQVTHAGRYSKPRGPRSGKAAPLNPYLDGPHAPNGVWADSDLDELRDVFIDRIRLATEAGFDAVDIKACHGYLVAELLGAYTRPNSRYGGSFENRARLLLDIVRGARDKVPGARVAVRLNASDLVPYPYGFGMAPDGTARIDLTEPRALVRQLIALGCCLINVTAGIPRHAAHAVRPYDRPITGGSIPPEHPLIGVTRQLQLAAAIQQEAGEVPVVGSGYSWLRRFWPNVGAAVVGRGMASFVGLGRGAFAYPDAAHDLMTTGRLDASSCCTACSRCVELMRGGFTTGCVVRDRPLYARTYRAGFPRQVQEK